MVSTEKASSATSKKPNKERTGKSKVVHITSKLNNFVQAARRSVLSRPGTGRRTIDFLNQIPLSYNVTPDIASGKCYILPITSGCTLNFLIFITVDIVLPGVQENVKFELKNVVMDTSRFEQYPGFASASQYANGRTYSIIPGLDTVYKDTPTMFFDEKRVCTTVYIPGNIIMSSPPHSKLMQNVNKILYSIFCESKIPMTDASKMSSGPLDVKQYLMHHRTEGMQTTQIYYIIMVNLVDNLHSSFQ